MLQVLWRLKSTSTRSSGTCARSLRTKIHNQRTFLDRTIPRTSYGRSIFSTPVLLFLRLIFPLSVPLDKYEVSAAQSPAAASKTTVASALQESGIAPQYHGSESYDSSHSIPIRRWITFLQDSAYPIDATWTLDSATWIHSLGEFIPISETFSLCLLLLSMQFSVRPRDVRLISSIPINSLRLRYLRTHVEVPC